jgi:hypothetical protein
MYDKELVVDILKDVLSSMEHVLRRFQAIRSICAVRDDGFSATEAQSQTTYQA